MRPNSVFCSLFWNNESKILVLYTDTKQRVKSCLFIDSDDKEIINWVQVFIVCFYFTTSQWREAVCWRTPWRIQMLGDGRRSIRLDVCSSSQSKRLSLSVSLCLPPAPTNYVHQNTTFRQHELFRLPLYLCSCSKAWPTFATNTINCLHIPLDRTTKQANW